MCIRDSYTHLIIGLTGSPLRLLSVEQRKGGAIVALEGLTPVSYTHLRAHETVLDLVCRLLLEKKKNQTSCTAQH